MKNRNNILRIGAIIIIALSILLSTTVLSTNSEQNELSEALHSIKNKTTQVQNNIITIKSNELKHRASTYNGDWIYYHTGYDNNAIGLTGGGTYQGAIRFTSDEFQPNYCNYKLTIVKFYHHVYQDTSESHSGIIKIYGEGTSTQPGSLVTSEPYTVIGDGWFEVVLSNPVLINCNNDLWVSVEVTHEAGEYPLGIDAGPAVEGKGDWIEHDTEWTELYYWNWCIEAYVVGDNFSQWTNPEPDIFPHTIAIKVLNLPILGKKDIQVVIRGATIIDRAKPERNPDGRWQIETEIISMDLTGYIRGMPIQIRESPDKNSTGIIRQITPNIDFPAESFFDVYVEIQTPLPSPFNIIYNKEPVIMTNIIDYIPPYLDNYTSNNTPVPLYTKTGIFSTRPIGYIVNASHLLPPEPSELEVNMTRPKEGQLYIMDIELIPFQRTIVVGPITIEAESDTPLDKVRFYIDGKLKNTDISPPYSWTWSEKPFFLQHLIQVIAYDNAGNIASDDIVVMKLF